MSSICRIYAGIIGLFRLIIKKDFFREEIVMIVWCFFAVLLFFRKIHFKNLL